jgi:hypothetical protein
MSMPFRLRESLRSPWFVLGIHAGLWLLLYLSIARLGGRTPDYHAATTYSPPPQIPVPVAKLENLFSPSQLTKTSGDTNFSNPFFSSYFVPPPSPAVPIPTTRKIEVTYQGFYQSGDGPRHAVVKVADAFVDIPIGWPVATNVFIAEATMQSMLLTNLTAQTNLLPLNVKKEIEIPIK